MDARAETNRIRFRAPTREARRVDAARGTCPLRPPPLRRPRLRRAIRARIPDPSRLRLDACGARRRVALPNRQGERGASCSSPDTARTESTLLSLELMAHLRLAA